MKKPLHHFTVQLLFLLLCISTGALKGQMAGVYAVPGSFTSVGAAIQELNIQGVSGPVTVNVSAGWTESVTPGGYTLFTIVGSSTVNTVTFQKSGNGNNPLIIAFTGSNTPTSVAQDGIWRMIGVDNLTINGIDLFDHNTSNPATMEFGYGFFKENAGNGCQNNQIRNCTITLNRINNALGSGPAVEGSRGIDVVNALSGAHTTALTPTTVAGSNSNNRFYNNVIQNVNTGISVQGFAAAAPFTFADFGNDIGGSSAVTSNTIINFGGGGTNPATGINTTAQYNFNASFNFINSNFLGAGVNHNGILRGILVNTANSSNHAINSNTITVHSGGTTTGLFGINNAAGSTPSNNSVSINNNLVTNCTYTSSTSGVFNAIINTANPSSITINNNVISNFTIAGTGIHPIIAAGSVSMTSLSNNTVTNGVFTGASGTARGITWTSPTNLTCSSNIVDGIAYTATASTGGIDGLYGLSAAINVTLTNNLVRNLAVPATGVINGIREFGSSAGIKFISNNTINSFSVSAGGLGGATMNGIFCSTGSLTVSGNTVSALLSIGTNTAAIGALYGIQIAGGTSVVVARNKVFNISANGSNPVVGGVLLSAGITTVVNNLIGSLSTPSAAAVNAVLGINVSGGTTHFIAYNSVYLSATSSSSLFGSTAINFASVTPTITLMNNIFNNSSTPSGTGIAAAMRRNLNSNNLTVLSNANIYWAGNPSTTNLILSDPSNAIQTIAAYKSLFTNGTEWHSTTENTPFQTTVGSFTNYLNISTSAGSAAESGGMPIASVLEDHIGTVRNTNLPDIGAWEGAFTPTNTGVPPMLLNPGYIGNSCNTAVRVVTVNINDINVISSGSVAPRVYYRVNANAYTSTPGVLASGSATSGIWSFTLNYTASIGDVLSWYVIAQDNQNNISANPSHGLVATNVNNVTTPPVSHYSFTIGGTLNGIYTVGSSGNFTTLTQAVNAYNTSCLTGSVTFSLINTTYSVNETYPLVFLNNPTASSSNSLLIIPTQGTQVVIQPTVTSIPAVFKFLNARFISINGSNGTGSGLTIINSNSTTASAAIWLASSNTAGSGNNSISVRNTTVLGGAAQVLNQFGIVAGIDGLTPSTAGGSDNDNIQITGNTMSNCYHVIYGIGTTSLSSGGLDNWFISNNLIGPGTLGSTSPGGNGIFLSNATTPTVSLNTLRNFTTTASAIGGIMFSNNVNNFVVNQNTLTGIYSSGAGSGTSSNCGMLFGTNVIIGIISNNTMTGIINNNTGGWAVRGMILASANANSNLRVFNNMMSDVSTVDWGGGFTYSTVGLELNGAIGGVDIEHNTIHLYGQRVGSTVTGNLFSCLLIGSTAQGNIRVRNNIFVNTYANTNDLGGKAYAIYSSAPNTNFTTIDNNNYFVGGTGNVPVPAFLGGDLLTLSAIQTAYGQNTNSKLLPVAFVSNTDLHIQTTSTVNFAIDNQGMALPAVSVDIDGQNRSSSNPDMGADEFTVTATCSSANGGTIAGTSYTVCAGSPLSLSSNNPSGGVGTAYQWQVSATTGGPYSNVSGGVGATTSAYSNSTLTPGVYYMVHRATCGTVTAASNEVTVTIAAQPVPTIVATPSVICAPATNVTLTANGPASSFVWNTGATTNSIVVTPTASGVYSVMGIASSCTNAVSQGFNLFFSSPPSLTLTAINPTLCSGNTATMTATGADLYSWNNGSTPLNGASVSPVLQTSQTYTVTGSRITGCASTATLGVAVFATPTLNIAGSTGICTGQTASLLVTGAQNYSWSTGSTSNSISVAPTSNTSYTVTGISNAGCSAIAVQSVAVAASLSITINGPSAICNGQSLNLSAGGGVTYTWNTGSTTSTLALTPTVTTTYSVVGASGSCSNTAVRTITVNPLPSVTVSGNSVICRGQTTTLTANGAVSYSWNIGATGSVVALSPTVNTTYTVNGFNSFGCTTTSTYAVVSNSTPILAIARSASIVCFSSVASMTASGANTYTWSTGQTTSQININPTVSAVYSVSGTNAAGCVSTTSTTIGIFQLPNVNITPSSATVCALSPVTFSASGATTYTWNNTLTGATALFNPSMASVYSVTGTDANGCVNSKTVAVSTLTLPILNVTPPSATICSQSSLALNAGGANTYTWVNAQSNSTMLAVNPSTSTNYTLMGTNAQGCTNSTVMSVTTLSLPIVGISPTLTTVCPNVPITFTANGAATFTWANSTQSTTAIFTPTANSQFSVTGTDGFGCKSSAIAIVLTYPVPQLAITPNTATICALDGVTLQASGADNYNWSSGATTASALVNPSATTIYTVTGTEIQNNCFSQATVQVVALPLPNLTLAASDSAICVGSQVSFTASGANVYSWSNGSLSNQTTVNPSITTVYTLSGTDNNGCSNSVTYTLIVNQNPVITLSSVRNFSLCRGESITVSATGGSTYTWQPSNQTGNTLTLTPSGTNFYTVATTDNNNCTSIKQFVITVNRCTGLEENERGLTQIYPNPSTGKFNIHFNNTGSKHVLVFTAAGQLIKEMTTELTDETFELNEFAKGIYHVVVKQLDKTETFKVIVQ
jgi:hypothetical protein